jgi:hypothetical protein
MSEESVPKLRLKPKLGPDPVTPAQSAGGESAPATPPVESPSPAPEPPVEAPVRLKPRLSSPPMQVAPAPEIAAAPMPTPPETPPPEVPADVKPTVKFSLRPKAAPAEPPPEEAPEAPPAEVEAGAVELPPVDEYAPSSVTETDSGQHGEPAEVTAMRLASSTPFPEPGETNFPPPPGFMAHLQGAEKSAQGLGRKKGASSWKKLFILAGSAAAVLLIAGGALYYFMRPKELPPLPPRRPKPIVKPVEAKAPEPAKVAVTEAPKPVPTVAKPAEPVVAAPKEPPPPPVASAAFKGWVDNVKILGIRSGSAVRIFIGGTSYAPGDLINPQLGITFDSYNAETRMVRFKDQTGATVEQRN